MLLIRVLEVFLSFVLPALAQQKFVQKYLYKHSFYAPKLNLRDGRIPFWELAGDAIAGPELLRLVPSVKSKNGIAWNVRPLIESQWWIVEFSFQIKGPGKIGADGMAFWYTALKGRPGNVFGSNDHWHGLAIFLDSYDNDGKGDNPLVGAMLNDGTKTFDHSSDGSQQLFASCKNDYRNRPFPVSLTDGLSPQSPYQACLSASNVFLPVNGYFGLSAATGGMADDHDVFSFMVFGLLPESATTTAKTQITDEQRRKQLEEFERKVKEFETAKEKFKAEHPQAKHEISSDEDEESIERQEEDQSVRHLRLILESQTNMRLAIERFGNMLNHISEQQNSLSTVLSSHPPGGPAVAPGAGSALASGQILSRVEVDKIMDFINSARAVFQQQQLSLQQLMSKLGGMEITVQALSAGGQAAGGHHGMDSFTLNAIKPYLDAIKQDIEHLSSAQRAKALPLTNNESRCLNPTVFGIALTVQSFLLIAMIYLRSRSDKMKFY
ncbi:Legume-like lectin family protein [Trichuris suis]|nr:Legume-like lectin family protein [Trichuris suis]